MRFLIDGYNLLHAIGWAARSSSGVSWERSRTRMLDWLASLHEAGVDEVTIIFDAQHVRQPGADYRHKSLHVGFSHHQTADDRIEGMLASETDPRRLRVISNDTRLQLAARREGCAFWTCERYLDWLTDEEARAGTTAALPEQPEKCEEATDAEMAEWLRVFEEPKKKPGKKR